MVSERDEELAAAAQGFYEQELKALLEPSHMGEYVAIDAEARLFGVSSDPVAAFENLSAQGARSKPVLLRVGSAWTFQMLSH